jgi:hypothetical protein
MTQRSTAGSRPSRRMALALLASALMTVGYPAIAASSAAANGADRQVPATFGDCKNHNSGVHNGYDCPEPVGGLPS